MLAYAIMVITGQRVGGVPRMSLLYGRLREALTFYAEEGRWKPSGILAPNIAENESASSSRPNVGKKVTTTPCRLARIEHVAAHKSIFETPLSPTKILRRRRHFGYISAVH